MDWELYRTKLYAYGETASERHIEQAKEDFCREAQKNPARHKALRNGKEQYFLITRSEVPEKYKIVAFPGEDLDVGDEIEVFGEHWIVYQVRAEDTLQKSGIIWMCNHKFRWQNFTSDIVEKWGVLDSGVYSTTIKGEVEVRYKDKQFKIIFPLDDDTKKLFIDKRLAVDKVYDKFGNEILNVYQITGYDSVGESFGSGGHLLILNIRSDEFNRDTDNIENLICDYIYPKSGQKDDELLSCDIVGKSEIRVGTTRKYSALSDNDEFVALWNVECDSNKISYRTDGNDLFITVDNDESLINKVMGIKLSDTSGLYSAVEKEIRVIGL